MKMPEYLQAGALTRLLRLSVAMFVLLVAVSGSAYALTVEQARSMSVGSSNDRIEAIAQAVKEELANPVKAEGDEMSSSKALEAFLKAMSARKVKTLDDRILVGKGPKTRDAVTGEPVDATGAKSVRVNNRFRREIKTALAGLKLASPDAQVRFEAVDQLAALRSKRSNELLSIAEQSEQDKRVKSRLALARARVGVSDPDPAVRLAAAEQLARSDTLEVRQLLRDRLAEVDGTPTEPDEAVRKALKLAYADVEHRVFMSEIGGTLFAGVSLGSILLLAALGLAITYGLMGVINLAHGELIMIGAYATYVAQQLFRQWMPPAAFDYYLWAAVPLSFLVAALVGVLLERLVIRFLYGRTLETLLATWGISLILMQGVRDLFGAQNVAVENPAWMSGGIEISSNLVLPFNRVAIIVFAFIVMAAVVLLIARTRLGLFVRATTQNRVMAQCVGVPTRNTDTMAFALGAGLAGLAGCALSQIGNVGPDLGQSYIVDSFLVVVVGGVGQLAGAVVAALGLGIFNKVIEGMSGAVIAKIVLLVTVIVFIQKRPQGIFALRGRSVEA
ncbi:MAG: urea ABC transporter permease subunit UrtB [Burkholderiaceae bacterium]